MTKDTTNSSIKGVLVNLRCAGRQPLWAGDGMARGVVVTASL